MKNKKCCLNNKIFRQTNLKYVKLNNTKQKGDNNMDKCIEWKNFKGKTWKEEINVSAFIDDNYTEYMSVDSENTG